MIGVILAGGDGTRLKTSTGQDICKSLRKIKDKHLIEFALDNLIETGVEKAYVVVGKQGDLIKDALGDAYGDIAIEYVHQPQQIGLVNAFVQALNVIDCNEPIILQLADEIFVKLNAEAIKNAFKTDDVAFYCGVTPEENIDKIKNNFSVETDENSFLVKCTEKPEVVVNNIKGTGFSIFSGEACEIIKEKYESDPDNFSDLCDCFNYFIASGYKGLVFNVAEREFNINTSSDLMEAESYFE